MLLASEAKRPLLHLLHQLAPLRRERGWSDLKNHTDQSLGYISPLPMLSSPLGRRMRNTAVNVGPAPKHPENEGWKTITLLLIGNPGQLGGSQNFCWSIPVSRVSKTEERIFSPPGLYGPEAEGAAAWKPIDNTPWAHVAQSRCNVVRWGVCW